LAAAFDIEQLVIPSDSLVDASSTSPLFRFFCLDSWFIAAPVAFVVFVAVVVVVVVVAAIDTLLIPSNFFANMVIGGPHN
jgi:hypothetical protein